MDLSRVQKAMTSERERAAYYEANKDDPDEWGEAKPPTRPRRRLASMFSVRLAPAEAAVVRQAAESSGISVSAFLRTAALTEAMHGRSWIMPPKVEEPSRAEVDLSFATSFEGADVAAIGGTARPQFTAAWGAIPA